MFKYLRIAFSATCLIACVLLIALWVRSYWREDEATVRLSQTDAVECASRVGRITFDFCRFHDSTTANPRTMKSNAPIPNDVPYTQIAGPSFYAATVDEPEYLMRFVTVPHWLPVLLIAVIGSAPWLRWQFGLSALLIATTLVAVVLGLVAWL